MKYIFLLLSGLLAQLAMAQTRSRADSLLLQAQVASQGKDYPRAIAAYQRVLQESTTPSRYKGSSLYNIACYYGLLQDTAQARRYLAQAIRAGYVKASHIAVDTDLSLLHTDRQWFRLLARARRREARTLIRRPGQVKLVTTDIDHFWSAYAAARQDTAQARVRFRQTYFAPGSVGLQDYYQLKIKQDASFARAILQRPRYYQSIQATTQAIAAEKPRIIAAFRRFQQLYPAVQFQHIYFVIGGWVSGGTVSEAGLLIGADQIANGPGVDTSELTLVQRNRCEPVTTLPSLMVHELVHRNQGPQDGTLLSYALNEGMADFVAELVTGHNPNQRLHPYGNAHEQELWLAFKQEMGGRDPHNWIANGRQETPEKPCDLGYYIGYRIVQAYYNKQADKQQALRYMLTLRDPQAFLRESGYETTLTQR